MKKFTLFILCCIAFLGIGITYGYILGDAPHVEQTIKMQQRLHFRNEEIKEYRKRMVEWSYYAWTLEHTDNNKQLMVTANNKG